MPEMGELKAALESILFVADRPVDITELRRILDIPREAVDDLLGILVSDYEDRGIHIARFRDTVRMVTAPESAPFIQVFLGLEQTVRLSSAALEALAIIAFRQPVTKAQIEAIRGVNSDGVIDTLEGRGLIEETGRLDSPGHPMQYCTTMAFLQHFGLQSLDELKPHDFQEPEEQPVTVQTDMLSEQQRLAARLRSVPARFQAVVEDVGDDALRHRPADGEWSAVEVLGHMVDKMTIWRGRVEAVLQDDKPFLAGYDQDEHVRERKYQVDDPEQLLERLEAACESFAQTIEALPDTTLERLGVHEEMGEMTLRAIIDAPLDSVEEHLYQAAEAIRSEASTPED